MKPPYRTGMNGTKTASIMLIKDGAMPHSTSNSRTRTQHLHRIERHERRKPEEEQKDQLEEAQIRVRGNVPRHVPARVTIPCHLSQQVRKKSLNFILPQQSSQCSTLCCLVLLNASILTGTLPTSFWTQDAPVPWVPAMPSID